MARHKRRPGETVAQEKARLARRGIGKLVSSRAKAGTPLKQKTRIVARARRRLTR